MTNKSVFFILVVILSSCSFLEADKTNNTIVLDTIIDFTSVDLSPAFLNCESLIDDDRTVCFRQTMQDKMTLGLKDLSLVLEDELQETVMVVLTINSKGSVSLKKVIYPVYFEEKNIRFDHAIEKAIESLPKLAPAIKKGIPVATEYKLPVNIIAN